MKQKVAKKNEHPNDLEVQLALRPTIAAICGKVLGAEDPYAEATAIQEDINAYVRSRKIPLTPLVEVHRAMFHFSVGMPTMAAGVGGGGRVAMSAGGGNTMISEELIRCGPLVRQYEYRWKNWICTVYQNSCASFHLCYGVPATGKGKGPAQ